jgi:hypothetical protein
MISDTAKTFDKWSLHYGTSVCEGLVVSQVRLNGRLMAERMSVPYLYIVTCTSPSDIQHCLNTTTRHVVLRPDADEAQTDLTAFTHVTLLGAPTSSQVTAPSGPPCLGRMACNRFDVSASYRITMSAASGGPYVDVTERYEFYQSFNERQFQDIACEPSQSIPGAGIVATPLADCGRWKPIVAYSFHSGTVGQTLLVSLNAAARLHYTPDALAGRASALMRDCDRAAPGDNCSPFLPLVPNLSLEVFKPGNPQMAISNEAVIRAFQANQTGNSTDSGRYDNVHVTPAHEVTSPIQTFGSAGCPECVHMHWRWGADLGAPSFFGDGQPLIRDAEPAAQPNLNSHQQLDVGLVAYHSNELAPSHFMRLVQDAQPSRLDVSVDASNHFIGGWTSGSETLEYPSGSCSDTGDLASWGQCGEVVWLSATSYTVSSHDEDSDNFFAFGGFFCGTCTKASTAPSADEYANLVSGLVPAYRAAQHVAHSNSVGRGETFTIAFSSVSHGIQFNDVLPPGLLNLTANYVQIDPTSGRPIGSPTQCAVAVDRLGRQVVTCDLSTFQNDERFNVTVGGLVSSTVTPGTYLNTVHVIWGLEHSNSKIGGNYKASDVITILPTGPS